jgi:coproporphyrinogen III oxidase
MPEFLKTPIVEYYQKLINSRHFDKWVESLRLYDLLKSGYYIRLTPVADHGGVGVQFVATPAPVQQQLGGVKRE